jgi:hypothetical protein
MSMSRKLANAPKQEFPEWRAQHKNCRVVRLESGQDGIALVSYVCRDHRVMLVADIVRPVQPGADPFDVE